MKESEMSDGKKANETDWGPAGLDFSKLIESCQISGVDMKALLDVEKKNIDALIEINRSAYDNWRSLMTRQAEVFQETMKAIAAEASNEAVAGRRAEIARQGGGARQYAPARRDRHRAAEADWRDIASAFRRRNGGAARPHRKRLNFVDHKSSE
jgi:hypothetical protein